MATRATQYKATADPESVKKQQAKAVDEARKTQREEMMAARRTNAEAEMSPVTECSLVQQIDSDEEKDEQGEQLDAARQLVNELDQVAAAAAATAQPAPASPLFH